MSEFSHTSAFDCPHCGAELRSGAQHCRRCGASTDCGWEESDGRFAISDDADDDFDYDAFVAREFGDGERPPTEQTKQFWMRLVILAVVIALLLPFGLQLFTLL